MFRRWLVERTHQAEIAARDFLVDLLNSLESGNLIQLIINLQNMSWFP